MTNYPRDLDQSDVDRDADAMREAMISDLTGDFDPADLFGVCALIVDTYHNGDAQEFMNSRTPMDLIEMTQSNPEGVFEKIADALEIEFG